MLREAEEQQKLIQRDEFIKQHDFRIYCVAQWGTFVPHQPSTMLCA